MPRARCEPGLELGADSLGGRGGLGVGCVLRAWPKETPQAVLLDPRNHVAVQVGNGLGDDVVHRDERALRAHRIANRNAQPLRPGEERLDQLRGQVRQGLVVITGTEQNVTVEEGPHVEESEADGVVQDDVRGFIARHDPAEDAVGVRQRW